jgi:hypothetical protein
MTVAEVLQFYAPFAGRLGIVYWLGVLSNRVITLEGEKAFADERDIGWAGHARRRVPLVESAWPAK